MPKPLSSRPTPRPEPPVPENDAAAQFIGGATSLPPLETEPAPAHVGRKRRKALVPVNTRLPEELVDALDEASNITGISRQQIFADALAKYLPKLLKSAG